MLHSVVMYVMFDLVNITEIYVKNSVLCIIVVNFIIFCSYDRLWWILRLITVILYLSASYVSFLWVCIVPTSCIIVFLFTWQQLNLIVRYFSFHMATIEFNRRQFQIHTIDNIKAIVLVLFSVCLRLKDKLVNKKKLLTLTLS